MPFIKSSLFSSHTSLFNFNALVPPPRARTTPYHHLLIGPAEQRSIEHSRHVTPASRRTCHSWGLPNHVAVGFNFLPATAAKQSPDRVCCDRAAAFAGANWTPGTLRRLLHKAPLGTFPGEPMSCRSRLSGQGAAGEQPAWSPAGKGRGFLSGSGLQFEGIRSPCHAQLTRPIPPQLDPLLGSNPASQPAIIPFSFEGSKGSTRKTHSVASSP